MWHVTFTLLLFVAQTHPFHETPPPETHTEPAGELNLEDLFNLDVSVAALRAESVITTPAVVSRLDVAEYRKLGLNNLVDILAMVPGLAPIHTEIGTTTLMVRGLSEFFNQKVLFLLDGVPYWQAAHGDHPLFGIPIEAVSHLEIIRGPGSVLYGTNATAAVINVVLTAEANTNINVFLGNNQQRGLGFQQGGRLGTGMWRYQIAAEWQDSDGYQGTFSNREPPSFFPENTPSEGRIARRHGARSVLAKLVYDEDLTLFLHAFSSESTGLAGPARLTNQSELQYTGRLIHLSKRFFGPKWEFQAYADHNIFYLAIPTNNLFGGRADGTQRFSDHGRDNLRYRLGSKFTWWLNHGLSLNAGLEYEHRSTGRYQNVPDDPLLPTVTTMEPGHLDERALFSQLDWQHKGWRFLAGFRHTDLGHADAQTQPRLAVIRKLSDTLSLKALYSEGFNSPNFVQTSIAIDNVIFGNPQLLPEKVKTIDLVLNYATRQRVFIANLYQFRGNDFILRAPRTEGPGSTYINSPSIARSGFELDYQVSLDKVRFFANTAFNESGNRDKLKDPSALFTPRWISSLGGSLSAGDTTRLGLSLRYISEREAAPAHSRLNVSYTYVNRRFELKVTLDNLLAQEVYFSDIVNLQRNRISPSADPNTAIQVEGRLKLGAR